MKTIGIIALSGAVNEEKLNNAIIYLKSRGYNIKLSENIFDKNRYLAGSDESKINELYRFFQDKDIDLIMCARGGYGAIRLVNRIDYGIIKNNPKPFIGFSDVTALLLMIYKQTGIITYHGPMICSDFSGDNHLNNKADYSLNNLLTALNSESLEFTGKYNYKIGEAQGIIWGGNLSTVVSLCGQDFIPDKDFIFFTEDLNEPVYKIDKMFQQLINIEKFRYNCRGIILGDFLGVDNPDWLAEYFSEQAKTLNIPIVSGFNITHNPGKITIPVGCKASLKNLVLQIFV